MWRYAYSGRQRNKIIRPCCFSSVSLAKQREYSRAEKEICLRDIPEILQARSFEERAWLCEGMITLTEDCIFGGFSNPELDNFLCLYLDGFTGCRVSAHAGFALYKYELAEPRQREGVLCFFISHLCDELQYLSGCLLGK